jgi:hypothetical protein
MRPFFAACSAVLRQSQTETQKRHWYTFKKHALMHSFRTPSLSKKESGVIYCNQCDNKTRDVGVYEMVITTCYRAATVHVVGERLFAPYSGLSASYSHSCPGYQVFAPVMKLDPKGVGGIFFIPTRGTLTDTLWCNSDSLYKRECWREVEAFVVQ